MLIPPQTLTLIIPYRFDSPERKRNFDLVTSYFHHHAPSITLLPIEQSGSLIPVTPYTDFRLFFHSSQTLFHKTRLINQGLAMTRTPVVGVLDADVLCDLRRVEEAVDAVLSGSVDLVYPYDGTFLEVPDCSVVDFASRFGDEKVVNVQTNLVACDSFGGMFVCSTELFKTLGGANERFVSWGCEDREIPLRFHRCGYRVARTVGAVYHLEHPRTLNSGPSHLHYDENRRQWERLCELKSVEEWAEEIEGFEWRARLV